MERITFEKKSNSKKAHMWQTREISIQQELRNEEESNKGKNRVYEELSIAVLCVWPTEMDKNIYTIYI